MPVLHKPLSNSFVNAVDLAHQIHLRQPRKGTQVPYLAHVMGVAAMVLEYGGSETEAIAALLHDAIEDAPAGMTVQQVRGDIRARFGDEVLSIVEHCTDTDVQPKPPWGARKAAYLASLEHPPAAALRVSAADKLHNIQALIRDYRALGDDLWARFNPEAGMAGTLGYYRGLVEVFKRRLPGPLSDDLERAFDTLANLVTGTVPQ